MRVIAGTKWGADKEVLLKVYRSMPIDISRVVKEHVKLVA